jgi:tRNA (cytidine/uridine-2'-O-)-methyltransferase
VFHLVLVEPEIPPNTGNVIRLCANTGCRLHLVEPLGFRIDAPAVRRAGLDYHELAELAVHGSFAACLAAIGGAPRWFAVSTRGLTRYDRARYLPGDVFVFGAETRGLPGAVLEACAPERRLRIPMRPGARSLNLSNAVALLAYEAWRQQDFAPLSPPLP